jgi:hypothetical protein
MRTVHVDVASAFAAADVSSSPLWLVTQEPALTGLMRYLDAKREAILANPTQAHVLEFSRGDLDAVRTAFDRMIRRGEQQLHQLCELLCSTFFDGGQLLHSVVVGEVGEGRERFTLVQTITRDDLYSQTDLDLGTRHLQRFRYLERDTWRTASLVANFVEYQPIQLNGSGIHKVISRIKAEEQIWNKVVDALFGLQALVRLDKQLSHLSTYVKDVFAIKLVVSDAAAARLVHDTLMTLTWSAQQLQAHGVAVDADRARLAPVEIKNYLVRGAGQKRSGWGAIKSVVQWGGTMIEIQVQPMTNYHRERERLTRESHAGFKARREQLRQQVSETIPLFGFYCRLLRWLFLRTTEPAPEFPSVSIVMRE